MAAHGWHVDSVRECPVATCERDRPADRVLRQPPAEDLVGSIAPSKPTRFRAYLDLTMTAAL